MNLKKGSETKEAGSSVWKSCSQRKVNHKMQTTSEVVEHFKKFTVILTVN